MDAIDVTQGDAQAAVKALTGLGADLVVDAVGNQLGAGGAPGAARPPGWCSLACAHTTTRPSIST